MVNGYIFYLRKNNVILKESQIINFLVLMLTIFPVTTIHIIRFMIMVKLLLKAKQIPFHNPQFMQ